MRTDIERAWSLDAAEGALAGGLVFLALKMAASASSSGVVGLFHPLRMIAALVLGPGAGMTTRGMVVSRRCWTACTLDARTHNESHDTPEQLGVTCERQPTANPVASAAKRAPALRKFPDLGDHGRQRSRISALGGLEPPMVFVGRQLLLLPLAVQ